MTSPSFETDLWVKDPDDTFWFEFDWSDFLEFGLNPGETITSFTITSATGSGVTVLNSQATNTAVQFAVTGGTDGVNAIITNVINTSASNEYQTEKIIFVQTRTS